EQEQEIALFAAWNQRRYIRSGIERNDMAFELSGNTDSLLENLGLSSHREGFCKASDFAGLKDQYIRKYGRHV
ncbi:hypothetical protein NA56DRAFT_561958, partial [Hyaloscypha hepaticicola]